MLSKEVLHVAKVHRDKARKHLLAAQLLEKTVVVPEKPVVDSGVGIARAREGRIWTTEPSASYRQSCLPKSA